MLSIIVNSSDSSRGSRPDRGAQNRASDQEEYMRRSWTVFVISQAYFAGCQCKDLHKMLYETSFLGCLFILI